MVATISVSTERKRGLVWNTWVPTRSVVTWVSDVLSGKSSASTMPTFEVEEVWNLCTPSALSTEKEHVKSFAREVRRVVQVPFTLAFHFICREAPAEIIIERNNSLLHCSTQKKCALNEMEWIWGVHSYLNDVPSLRPYSDQAGGGRTKFYVLPIPLQTFPHMLESPICVRTMSLKWRRHPLERHIRLSYSCSRCQGAWAIAEYTTYESLWE